MIKSMIKHIPQNIFSGSRNIRMKLLTNSSMKFIYLAPCILLFGCATHSNYIGGTYTPSLANNYTGLIARELFGGIPEDIMASNCSPYGGLNRASITKSNAPPNWKLYALDHNYWIYRCNGVVQNNSQNSIPDVRRDVNPLRNSEILNNQNKISVDEAKSKCKDLGFKEGTEKFSDCALKIIRQN